RDREAFQLDERRQKPVHALEKFQVLNALAFAGAIGATGVADLFTRQFVAHPIGNARRCNANEIVAFPARPDTRAANAIELFQRFEKSWQIARIVLQIGVERDEILAARGFQSCPTGCRLAAIELESLGAN